MVFEGGRRKDSLNIPHGGEGEQEMPRDVCNWKIGDVEFGETKVKRWKNIVNYI